MDGLGAKAARLVVTTELPAFLYRAQPDQDAIIALPGIRAETPTFIGSVDSISIEQRTRWLQEVRAYGAHAA
jgi:putative NADPH-quinone reductase